LERSGPFKTDARLEICGSGVGVTLCCLEYVETTVEAGVNIWWPDDEFVSIDVATSASEDIVSDLADVKEPFEIQDIKLRTPRPEIRPHEYSNRNLGPD
jgi:hypothetical protein